ncbi:MAG TPA: DUF4145 domain-containing protein [Verrucomicrobia subdivision 3 bacterium]|nr:DUF4145 domain-containing protein [Limisphaerales bacterium]
MKGHDSIIKRFAELESQTSALRRSRSDFGMCVDSGDFQRWSTNAQNLIKIAFGENSPHYENFKAAYNSFHGYEYEFENVKGVFLASKSDFEGGFGTTLEALVSGEIFGDFVGLAKEALSNDKKDVAAVLACAALEDALKRYAVSQGISVDGKEMTDVVNALKSKGLVGGAQKSLLDTMPKIRNFAMHADWSKITPQDVGSVIGFTEQFLLQNF